MALERIRAPGSSDKWRRALWQLAWLLLYRPTPNQLHAWRRFLLRRFGATVEAGAHPYPKARIWAPWNLVMEANSCLGNESDCYNVAPVILRRDCIVSQKAYLCTGSHDLSDADFALNGDRIEIGESAWVAAAAFVGPGVTMGARSVAAAGAVVTRDVEPDRIVGGNPARVIAVREVPDTVMTDELAPQID
jgi:putative colanic acid biosynthesis acetyltransferase WcaF